MPAADLRAKKWREVSQKGEFQELLPFNICVGVVPVKLMVTPPVPLIVPLKVLELLLMLLAIVSVPVPSVTLSTAANPDSD